MSSSAVQALQLTAVKTPAQVTDFVRRRAKTVALGESDRACVLYLTWGSTEHRQRPLGEGICLGGLRPHPKQDRAGSEISGKF